MLETTNVGRTLPLAELQIQGARGNPNIIKESVKQLEGKLGNKTATQMKKDKLNILKDVLIGKGMRQSNVQKIAAVRICMALVQTVSPQGSKG